MQAERQTLRCIDACRIDEIFSDSKFLESESLVDLCRAMIWSAGLQSGGATRGQESQDVGIFCLELLIHVTLRNRDRIFLLWPMVYDHFRSIVTTARAPATALVERAVMELLRISRRLLPYKEELSDELLLSLRLIFALDAKVADALLETIASEMLVLLKVRILLFLFYRSQSIILIDGCG